MTDYCGERTTDGPRCRERVPCPVHQAAEDDRPLTELDQVRAEVARCRETLKAAKAKR